ncbi:AmmeMemoRadiSam system radical SAM enzyme [Infirmifilum sp. NZ]|uniref:AmmeMemoRadiSam system radical SAM enzyme n=1 Tax=Infirmifilum sp. NZ TaxID=2926850 RepID=UPI0027A8A5C1|nr:AmmeMemoRadiSam system radical SAM enzyme [Infirmifilum sp. NZ]UNQ74010.1 AmmeMemoRadiSam system radical SAM enzyme [Infirmifilum sp. NZ]
MDSKSRPNVREALFWERVEGKPGYVRCNLCHRRCVIAPGRFGVCGVRKNIDGRLYTYVYGLLTAANLDPIEKKPLSHFNPGSAVFSISTPGCNFFCQFCQNWEISQSRLEKGLYGMQYTPERVVSEALRLGADGISYTYNEPTIFYEFMLDTAKLAKRSGLFNTMVTNGYMTQEALQELSKYMDAATVDFKGGGNPDFYRKFMGVPDPSPIYDTLLTMKEKGMHVEITNLVVPLVGDNEDDLKKLARWIADNLGVETPFHLLRFYPHYKMIDYPPTDVQKLDQLASIARGEGLKHVYVGNVWGHPLEHTYCPRCGYKVIERRGFFITKWNLTDDNRCPRCGYKLNIRGSYRKRNWEFEYFF